LHNRSIAQTQTQTLSFSVCLSLPSNQLHASQSCVFDCKRTCQCSCMHHLKGIATLSVGARGAGRRQVRGHAAWARTGNVGPSRADHGSVRGGQMLPERRTTRPPHGCRCRGNSSPPHTRISTLFRTLSFFSFSFLSFSSLVATR
jgi:hypothetical protein